MGPPGQKTEVVPLTHVVVASNNTEVAKRIEDYAVSWRGRAVRQVFVGAAIAGAALFVFLFVLGCIFDSERAKFAGVGFGCVGLMSYFTRTHCLGEYQYADMPLEM